MVFELMAVAVAVERLWWWGCLGGSDDELFLMMSYLPYCFLVWRNKGRIGKWCYRVILLVICKCRACLIIILMIEERGGYK